MTAVVLRADARALPLPDESVDLIVTSPPYYGLRDYRDGDMSLAGQIGSEPTPAAYVAALLDCTREWVRVLKPQGSLFVNLGDKYSSSAGPQTGQKSDALRSSRHGHAGGPKWAVTPRQPAATGALPKSLLGLPWRYALGCIDDLGLILRAEIIWAKPNGLPESVTDRVRRSHEQVFHFTRQPRYYSAVDEVREPHAAWTLKAYEYEQRARARNGGYNRRKNADRNDAGDAGDYAVANPLGKLPGSVWEIPSQPLTVPAALGTDHFAAFPMELPRRIIAGWSPPGICTACGEGRRPVVDKELAINHVQRNAYRPGSLNGHPRWDVAVGADRVVGTTAATITGYACACPQPDAPTRPAIVADPFGGTGTTALVASVLGRDGFSFDRSADYCRLARWRVTDPGERARAMQVPKPPTVMDGQAELFAL